MKTVSGLPMGIHLKLHATTLKQPTQTQTPLHNLNAHSDPPRNMKTTLFYSNEYTNIIISDPDITSEECKKISNTFTPTSHHYTSVPEKKNVLITHRMTFIYHNKHYHVICIQN